MKIFKFNKYQKLYLRFLKLEIPNFIQIVTVTSFFSYLSKNIYFAVVVSTFVLFLLNLYLVEAFVKYVYDEVGNLYPPLSVENIELKVFMEKSKVYAIFTGSLFAILVNVIALSISCT
jgi:hypothetical protein